MLRASITFFIIGLLAFVLGANNIGGLSVEIGKILLMVFVALAIVGVLVSLITGKNVKNLS